MSVKYTCVLTALILFTPQVCCSQDLPAGNERSRG